LDGIEYSERDFFEEQRENDRGWQWPLNLAIGLHIVVFAGAIILPDLIEHKPLLDNVVTVDLVSMPEPAAPKAAKPVVRPSAPPKQAPVVQPAEPRPEPKAPEVSIAPEVATPEPAAAPAKQISLKPLKRKIRKAKDTRLAEDKDRENRARALKQQAQARKKAEQEKKRREQARRRQAIADARRARQEADRAQQEADRAAARARQELASVIRERGPAGTSGRSSSSSSGRKVQSAVLKQYLSSLYERVHGYWVLPDMRKWDRGLETIVVRTHAAFSRSDVATNHRGRAPV